jgi:hypothetical protein
MRYSIAFKNLPFEPEKRQVIYVENQYDERINTYIRNNYEQIKASFKELLFDFVYLPMFFNDQETKEKILYYAPYLTSDIIEKAELRSSYLLKYMSHIENREKIMPSFIYAPYKEDDEWIFHGMPVDIDGVDKGSVKQWSRGVAFDIAVDFKSPKGSGTLFDEDYNDGVRFRIQEDEEEEPSKPKKSSTSRIRSIIKKWKLLYQKSEIPVKEDYQGESNEPSTPSLDEINEEDVRKTLEELERNVEKLRIEGIPLSVILEFVAKYETVSRLLLTNDLRIFLPDYNNLEIAMWPVCKAVYFLFLNHPEGIVLQHLEEYHIELVNYYLQTSKKDELTPRMVNTINKLEYPGDNTINYTLARINAFFRNAIDEHLAQNYYIKGIPGEPYKIALDKILIEWEDEK